MVTFAMSVPLLVTLSITTQPSYDALSSYRSAVNGYAQLHRDAAAGLAPGGLCGGPEQLELTREELTNEIRAARANAREGDIFDARTAEVLRARLRRALDDLEMDAREISASKPHGWRSRHASLEINGFFAWEAGPPGSSELFWALPLLPEEIEYRFVGGDLVLLDVQARLVVDILRDAVR